MNEVTPNELVRVEQFDGDEWLYFPSIPIDVAIIRGSTADDRGNISMEREGAYLGAYDQALAVRNNGGIVIAQVQRLAESGSIPPQQVRVPGILVDYVVVVPGADAMYATEYDPAISGEIRRPMDQFEGVEWGPDKVIARRAAQELKSGECRQPGVWDISPCPAESSWKRVCQKQLRGSLNKVQWVVCRYSVFNLAARQMPRHRPITRPIHLFSRRWL